MRALVAALVLALLAPWGAAAEPYVVLLDWTKGHTWAGANVAVDDATAFSFPLDVDACHRELLADVLYAPSNQTVAAEGVGSLTVPYEFRVELRAGAAVIGAGTVREPGYGTRFGVAPAAGEYAARLVLEQGAAVDWELRVRARAVFGEVACLPRVAVNEVEANPAGPDAGAERVELLNAADEAVDLSLWTLSTTHGETVTLELPSVVLASGERLVVAFSEGQALDNADESVVLRDAFGQVRDETPSLSDAADDGRTWQRSPDGSSAWAFKPGSLDEPNA